ncbi:MAG: hypothetical protein OEV42_14940 [Deltaproteobacteria bacterium]|nr:hypothetical protein [Deltaproteobacteria bacterium]
MANKNTKQGKPWFAITWFLLWGLFQSYAVFSVLTESWKRPEAFPEEAYNSLIYPDMLFIPLYIATSVLLFRNHQLGKTFALIAGGAIIYVMVYLLALSGLKGAENLVFDSLFLLINLIALLQIIKADPVQKEIEII